MKKTESPYLIDAIVLSLAILICVPLRLLQYNGGIEANTGFYIGFGPKFIIFYAVLIAALLFFVVSSVMKRKNIHIDTVPARRPGLGIISLLTGFSVIYSAYITYSNRNNNALTSNYVVSPNIPAAALILMEVLALVSAVYFILLGISYLSGKSTGANFRLLSLIPVLWNVMRLIIRFTTTISYMRVSDLMLDMIAFATYTLFFMTFAQANAQVGEDGYEVKLPASAFFGAVLGFVLFIPRIVLVITGRDDIFYILSYADPSDMMFGIFMAVTVLTRIAKGPKTNRIEEPAAEEPAE